MTNTNTRKLFDCKIVTFQDPENITQFDQKIIEENEKHIEEFIEEKKSVRRIKKLDTKIMGGNGMISIFQTEKYDDIFSDITDKLSLIFSLQTGKIFEETHLGDQKTHNKTIDECIDLLQFFEEMTDNDILVNYGCDDIQFMMTSEPNMDHLLPNNLYDKYYVIIFIDNTVIIIMKDMYGYMIRDVKVKNQFNFTDIDDLKFHLYEFYYLGEPNYDFPFKYYVKKC